MTNAFPTLLNEPLSPLRKLTDQAKSKDGPLPLNSPKSAFPTSPTSSPTTTTTTTTSSANLPNFRDLLALMMMSMTMGNGSGEDGGFSMSSMMAPIMMSLMEQLMSQEVTSTTTEENQLVAQTTPQGLPVEGRFTQYYHPGHNGVDIGIVTGTPIQTTMDGNVIYAGWNDQGYGNLVIVENGPYRTYYAHLSEIPVEVGQTVQAGEVIGLSGNTGNSTGPHLHYEVRYNGQPLDPAETF